MTKSIWDAVVLDLDGTLADTLLDIAKSTNAALINNGYSPWPTDKYRKMVGNGLRKLVERAAVGADEREVLLIVDDFLRIYDGDCLINTKVYEGMPQALAVMKESGIKLFVVTNKPDSQAKKIVKHLYGADFFEGVFGNKEGRKTKPDPTLALEVLGLVGAEPSRSLFVGDSDVDIFTATNAGMKSAGVTWGFRSKEELSSAGADFILNKPSEILDYLGN